MVGTGGCEGGGGGVCVWKEVEGLKDERARGKREEKRFFPRSGLSESRTAMLGGGVIPGQVEMGEYYRKRRPDHLAVQLDARTSQRHQLPTCPHTHIPRQLVGVGCGTQLAGRWDGQTVSRELLNRGMLSQIWRVRYKMSETSGLLRTRESSLALVTKLEGFGCAPDITNVHVDITVRSIDIIDSE